jgi:hypothetical protein
MLGWRGECPIKLKVCDTDRACSCHVSLVGGSTNFGEEGPGRTADSSSTTRRLFTGVRSHLQGQLEQRYLIREAILRASFIKSQVDCAI